MHAKSNLGILTVTWLLLIALFQPTARAATTLTDFSSGVVSDSLAWDSATRTWSGTQATGSLYSDGTGPWNLSNDAFSPNLLQAAVTATINSSTPIGSFNITLEDDTGNLIAATFSWDSFTVNTPTTVQAAFAGDSISSFNLASVLYWNLNSSGNTLPVNATFTGLSAVPEPSTGALMMLGAVGLVALRRLRKV